MMDSMGCFLWTEIRKGNEWIGALWISKGISSLAEIHGIFRLTRSWCSFLQFFLLFNDHFRVRHWPTSDFWRFLLTCLRNWTRTVMLSRHQVGPLLVSPDRWLQQKMCLDLVYHQNLELCHFPGKLSFNLLSPTTAPINFITPRTSTHITLYTNLHRWSSWSNCSHHCSLLFPTH